MRNYHLMEMVSKFRRYMMVMAVLNITKSTCRASVKT